MGDEARYILCAPFEGLCARNVVDVGVEGREFDPEVTVLVEADGEVDREEEAATFLTKRNSLAVFVLETFKCGFVY